MALKHTILAFSSSRQSLQRLPDVAKEACWLVWQLLSWKASQQQVYELAIRLNSRESRHEAIPQIGTVDKKKFTPSQSRGSRRTVDWLTCEPSAIREDLGRSVYGSSSSLRSLIVIREIERRRQLHQTLQQVKN